MNSTITKICPSLLLILCLSFSSYPVLGQYGYSSTGLAVGKLRAQQAVIPAPEEIVIEEYLNYHLHQLPLPKTGESVHLDLQWGRPDLEEEPVLQIGITTTFLSSVEDVPPMNLALVVDRSSSMSGDRIQNAREALKELCAQLRPTDVVSVIAFDHEAIVLYPAQAIGNGSQLLETISTLEVRGSTDLNSGILTGYRELSRFYEPSITNRMLILTDAITNTGVVDPNQIIANSKEFTHSYAVDCAMICLGSNFQHDLARQFTESGKSTFHFIEDAEDFQKVFVDEIQSLLAPVATDPVLEIEFDPNLELVELYGYSPVIKGNKILLALNQMNYGLTQVVLAKFRKKSAFLSRSPIVDAKLSFFDIQESRQHTLFESALLNAKQKNGPSLKELYKCYDIAEMASGLRDMATFHLHGEQKEAEEALSIALEEHELRKQSGLVAEDEDIARVEGILYAYQKRIEQ